METGDVLSLFTAYYKDKVEQQCALKIKQSFQELLEADVDARREIAKKHIISMAKLRICLQKFRILYDPIKAKYGSIESAEKKIREIECQIKLCSDAKNHV